MKKNALLILSLLFGIFNFPVFSWADSQVEVNIHTQREDGPKIAGVEKLVFDVYDMTDWRGEHGGDVKADKEFIMDTYPTKAHLLSFVKEAGFAKTNPTPYSVDEAGNVSFTVNRHNKERDAAYLILPNGETGESQMLPIILYLPEINPDTKEEEQKIVVYGKYLEITSVEPPAVVSSEPSKEITPTTKASAVNANTPSKKSFPSTNDLIRNFGFLGLLLVLIGFIGFTRNKK